MLSCYFGKMYPTNKKYKISSQTNKLQPPSLHDMPKVIKQKQRGNKRVYKTILFCHSDSGTSANRRNNGSATIEAMLILPLFLMAAFAFLYNWKFFSDGNVCLRGDAGNRAVFLQNISMYGNWQKSPEMQGKQTKQPERIMGKNVRQMGIVNVNCLTAKLQFDKYIDDSELLNTCVSGGGDGICFTKANYNSSDGCIYLSLKYELAAEIPFFLGQSDGKKQSRFARKRMLAC